MLDAGVDLRDVQIAARHVRRSRVGNRPSHRLVRPHERIASAIVTRISPEANGSAPGSKSGVQARRGVPATGVVVSGTPLPSYANSVRSLT